MINVYCIACLGVFLYIESRDFFLPFITISYIIAGIKKDFPIVKGLRGVATMDQKLGQPFVLDSICLPNGIQLATILSTFTLDIASCSLHVNTLNLLVETVRKGG